MVKKIIKHLQSKDFLHLIWIKTRFYLLNMIIRNKNITTIYIRNKNYIKLRKKFSKIINNFSSSEQKNKSNIIWFCWLQGLDNAPDLVKACYSSLKKNSKGFDIVVLNENNISDYIQFPDYIEKKYKAGKIGKAHYSDLLRISLLTKYGGMWIDSTVLCTSNNWLKYISNQQLFVFKQIELVREDIQPIVSSNWFISSESNNEICLLTQKLLFEYWKKYDYAIDYFIFHFFFSMATKKYPELWNKVPIFNNINPHIMQFELNNKYNDERWNQLINFSGLHKLNHHLIYKSNDTFYSYIIKSFYKGGK